MLSVTSFLEGPSIKNLNCFKFPLTIKALFTQYMKSKLSNSKATFTLPFLYGLQITIWYGYSYRGWLTFAVARCTSIKFRGLRSGKLIGHKNMCNREKARYLNASIIKVRLLNKLLFYKEYYNLYVLPYIIKWLNVLQKSRMSPLIK